jgi:hypothetical protein
MYHFVPYNKTMPTVHNLWQIWLHYDFVSDSFHSYIWFHVHILFNQFLFQLQYASNSSKKSSAFYMHLQVMDVTPFYWKSHIL